MLYSFEDLLDIIGGNAPKTGNTIDPRILRFKSLSYSRMSETIEDLEGLLSEMKELRKSKLDKEISDTESRLEELKKNLREGH